MTFDWKTQYLEYRKYLEQLMGQTRSPVARASFAVVGALLFTTFLILAALRPTLVTIASLYRSINDERQVIATLDKKIGLLQIAQQKLESIQEAIGPANVAIPSRIALEDFSRELEILASQWQLSVIEIHQENGFPLHNAAVPILQQGQLPSVSELVIRIVAGGTEESVRSFVADLENLDRLVIITSANFSHVKPEERKDRPYPVSADLSVKILTTQELQGKTKKTTPTSASAENSL